MWKTGEDFCVLSRFVLRGAVWIFLPDTYIIIHILDRRPICRGKRCPMTETVTAVIVAAAISYPAVAERVRFHQKRKEAERNG